ncbi:LMLN [Acanthosepion pharaonis]|uniref:Leishmanolysin-like peptidase n=1 Tax=Acanthosepion pharaonis TaxID=158019 RepID=A0A812DZU3_ACAPH|nr:LMLN [Sepia pharaonis]
MQYCVGKCAKKTICGDITIPEEHLETCYCVHCDSDGYQQRGTKGPGVNNTDFILYVAALSSERCHHGNTIAYAAYCQQERSLDRPVAGYFSICPNSLSTSPQLLSTIKHEILHALGFTAGLYAFYRDRDGNPLTNRSENLDAFFSPFSFTNFPFSFFDFLFLIFPFLFFLFSIFLCLFSFLFPFLSFFVLFVLFCSFCPFLFFFNFLLFFYFLFLAFFAFFSFFSFPVLLSLFLLFLV